MMRCVYRGRHCGETTPALIIATYTKHFRCLCIVRPNSCAVSKAYMYQPCDLKYVGLRRINNPRCWLFINNGTKLCTTLVLRG